MALTAAQIPKAPPFATDADGRLVAIEVHGVADSLVATAVSTAPGAGATVVSLAAPPAGVYEVRVYAGVSNNAVADLGNVKLQKGGVDLVGILPQGANGASVETVLPRVTLTGAQALAVLAIGAGTAAIEYAAQIVATRVE